MEKIFFHDFPSVHRMVDFLIKSYFPHECLKKTSLHITDNISVIIWGSTWGSLGTGRI